MNQKQRITYLIEELCRESGPYRGPQTGIEGQKVLLRSLMNMWMPKSMPEEFYKVQDEYLQQEAKDKGIVTWEEIPTVKAQYGSSGQGRDKISIWQGDITSLAVDAIVNAANSQMLGCFVPCHGCIDNVIHSAAGVQLRQECAEIMERQGHEEPAGGAKITKAYNLPCRFVLHTVGPIIRSQLTQEDCRVLEACYDSCLDLAQEQGLESLAFCCISTGEFHFPNEEAAKIAVRTVTERLEHSTLKRVIFNVFKDEDLGIYEELLG